jgi:hypothetical protein
MNYHRISEEGHFSAAPSSLAEDEDEQVLVTQPRRQQSSFPRLSNVCCCILVCVLSLCVGLMTSNVMMVDRAVDGFLGIFISVVPLLPFRLNMTESV